MTRKRLLYDARAITPKPCGVRNVAENYLRELASHYDIVALVNADTAHLIGSDVKKEIAPRHCSRFGILSDFWVSWLVLKHRPETFFSAHSFLPPFALLPRDRIFVCHDLFAALDASFFVKRGGLASFARAAFRLLSEISFFRARLVIAPSTAIADSFKQLWIQPRHVAIIHNGVVVPAHAAMPDQNRILYVGNFRSYKGFDTLFRAWQKLSKLSEFREWQLDIVTNEPEDAVVQFVARQEMPPRINFHIRISDRSLEQFRQTARIAAIPSRDEGFGIPLLEAISAGGIVVYSNIPVFRELTRGFDTLSMAEFAAGDADSLAATLLAIVRSGKIVPADTVVHNRERVREDYSWSAAAAKLIAELKVP